MVVGAHEDKANDARVAHCNDDAGGDPELVLSPCQVDRADCVDSFGEEEKGHVFY